MLVKRIWTYNLGASGCSLRLDVLQTKQNAFFSTYKMFFVVIPSLIITSRIQILQYDQHLVTMGTSSQAGGGPTALIGGVVLVPVCLHLVGCHLTSVGSVCVPAAGVLGLLWKLDVFDDHGRPLAALQVQPDDLPITAPQCLDVCTDTQG